MVCNAPLVDHLPGLIALFLPLPLPHSPPLSLSLSLSLVLSFSTYLFPFCTVTGLSQFSYPFLESLQKSSCTVLHVHHNGSMLECPPSNALSAIYSRRGQVTFDSIVQLRCCTWPNLPLFSVRPGSQGYQRCPPGLQVATGMLGLPHTMQTTVQESEVN